MSHRVTHRDGAVHKVLRFCMSSLPKAIIGSLILASIGINFANVIGRYVFLSPIIWAEEIMIYIMVWITFAGAVLVTWRNSHLSMDILLAPRPGFWKRAVRIFAALGFVAVCVFVIVQSSQVMAVFLRTAQVSVIAEIPMTIPHAAVLFGMVFMLFAVIVRFRLYAEGWLEDAVDETARRGAPLADFGVAEDPPGGPGGTDR